LKLAITRPQHQSEQLLARLREIGCEAVSVPTFSIEPIEVGPLPECKITVFTSANAATGYVERYGNLTESLCIAVGPSTQRALRKLGIHAEVPTERFDSEGVLAIINDKMPKLTNIDVAIVKGEGGRPYLEQQLVQLQARVHNIVLYRRKPFKTIDLSLFDDVSAIWVSSLESFDNLSKQTHEIWHDLTKLKWLVPSNRIAEAIRSKVSNVYVADSALDQDVVSLCQEMMHD